MPGALPGMPGSPEFMTALIEKEREFASRQREAKSKSGNVPTRHQPPTAAGTHVKVEGISSEPSRGVPWLPSPPLSQLRPAPRRGLSRVEAAMYIGVSPSKFDQMVMDGRMPKPRRIDARKVWDVRDLDVAFDALPGEGSPATGTSWDDR